MRGFAAQPPPNHPRRQKQGKGTKFGSVIAEGRYYTAFPQTYRAKMGDQFAAMVNAPVLVEERQLRKRLAREAGVERFSPSLVWRKIP
jgi:hypothetical protein